MSRREEIDADYQSRRQEIEARYRAWQAKRAEEELRVWFCLGCFLFVLIVSAVVGGGR